MKTLALILVLVASAAYGEIYRWTDSKGTTHFTNSIYEIPERYRDKAKTVNLGIPETRTESSPSAQPSSTAPPSYIAVPGQASPATPPVSQSQPAAFAPKPESLQERPVTRTNKSYRPRKRSDDDE